MFITHGHGLSVVAIFWIAIVAIVFFGNFFRYRERASRYRAIEKMAEKGQTVPPEMLMGGGRYRERDDHYRSPIWSGVYLMCIGVALFIFFWAMDGGGMPFAGDNRGDWLPFIGIFPFMIGVARLLAGLFDRPRVQ
ncbi:MAG TPA: DUF6249 domain-containing protein [Rhizomicrobium sp.]|jgi:hypothetical protein